MKTLIIDDEFHCRNVIRKYLIALGLNSSEIFEAGDVQEALEVTRTVKLDLVFLDIQLDELTGFDFLDRLEHYDFQLVFTTAFDQYAVKAFEYAAIHYLLKPVAQTAVLDVIQRAQNNELVLDSQNLKDVKFLYVSTENKSFNLSIPEITHIDADGSYCRIHLLNGQSVFSSKHLAEYERNLPEHFFRVHRSTLVNLMRVTEYRSKEGLIILSNKVRIAVSRRKKSSLKLYLSSIL